MIEVSCDRGLDSTVQNSDCLKSLQNDSLVAIENTSPLTAQIRTTPTTSLSIMNGISNSAHRPRTGSTREKVLNVVEYYNSTVLKSRVNAGLTCTSTRNSVNERHLVNGRPNGIFRSMQIANHRIYLNSDQLCRSNSSLELLHEQNGVQNDHLTLPGGNLRREYGSHGSIDVISSPSATTGESFFAMLQDYRPAVLGVIGTDQRSPGPAEFLKGKMYQPTSSVAIADDIKNQDRTDNTLNFDRSSDPKLRKKLHRIWAPTSNNHLASACKIKTREHFVSVEESSILSSSLSSSNSASSIALMPNQAISIHSASTSSADIEERQRRRAFAHFDCQSLTANLGYAAKLRGLLLARRRNTTTGASAASMVNSRSATPDAESGDEDYGDGKCNDLLENCPFFRNEVGGEEERDVSLTRLNLSKTSGRAIHRPALAYGVSILECGPNETLWRHTTCPFQKGQRAIESVDHGARYYEQFFYGRDHQNWFGMDEQLGPVAISLIREKLTESTSDAAQQFQQQQTPQLLQQQPQQQQAARYQFRLIIRTSELLTLRGSVLEDSVPNPRGVGKSVTSKEVLEYVAPEIQLNCLRLGMNTPQCEQQLIKLDQQGLTNKYKVGILYCRSGQCSEEDMYNNEDAGPAFIEFLETIGKRVRLKGFEHYKAGLDNKTDSTGTHSLYATHQDCEVMFHVSTMLPFTQNNRQQLLRKRHIGNDIVTIIFQEPGALPFTPKNIRSQFQHVFVIIRVNNPCSDNTSYKVAVSRSKEVPVFGPPIPAGAVFSRNKEFADFLLAKIINAENAAHRSEKFVTMATRTRQEYLKDLATNFCTTTSLDPGTKFSIFPSKKKEKPKIRFSGDVSQRGAFCWQVVLQDSGLSTAVDCFLGISIETFVLIEECSRQIIFVSPTKAILGWSTAGNSLRIYHHQGECLTINMRDSGERDEQLEVIERLRAVTMGCGALELNLRRSPLGQLGFHVQPDGVVTQVESSGQAWGAGLRQGYRLVEICKIAVATLSHDQMVDLLKTSAQVTVTVIESFSDFTPRRGCFLQNCKFNVFNFENDHEANSGSVISQSRSEVFDSPTKANTSKTSSAQLQQPVANQRRRYERNFSPPRSSNSSGYGTSSSSRSFSLPGEQHGKQITDMGTLTSSSSGHSSNDDRWYDILDNVVEQPTANSSNNSGPNSHNYTNLTSRTAVDHQKLAVSSSLPLNSNPRPLSIHDPTKVTFLADTHGPSHNQKYRNSEPEIVHMKYLTISHNVDIDANNTYTNNEPIYSSETNSPTGDDMSFKETPLRGKQKSFSTSNVSKNKNINSVTVSSSASSSRNNSPRPLVSDAVTASVSCKLRPGVTNRAQTHLMQRNSVNYSNSTFQEDLMKLINPDYLATEDSPVGANDDSKGGVSDNKRNIVHPHSLGNLSAVFLSDLKSVNKISEQFLLKKKSRSREAINLGQQPLLDLNKAQENGEAPEIIYTTARPATVITQVYNEELKTDNILHISEGTTPFKKPAPVNRKKSDRQVSSAPLPLLPDTDEMDWSTLVDTATRAMMFQFQEENRDQEQITGSASLDDDSKIQRGIEQHKYSEQQSYHSENSQHNHIHQKSIAHLQPTPPLQTFEASAEFAQAPELQTHLNHLEDRILRETRRRKSLEHAVRRLTEENRRLQHESQAAVQQLRRFTEWFFQTIDRQS